jgi:uncharacterized coiled-coil protein SlyX
MSTTRIGLRELNRATLARQMLLERETLAISAAIERLGGMQAQLASAPFIGLWTRLRDCSRQQLASSIEQRDVIKATWLRATLHLCTREDYVMFRSTLQPVLTGASSAIAKQRDQEFDSDQIVRMAYTFIAEQPRTFAEISAMLTEQWPEYDVGAMRYTVRTHLPLVQVPIQGGWSYPGNPAFALAEPWIGQEVTAEDQLPALVRRYLASFGPASVTDMQTWSGLPKLKDVFEQLRPELLVYRDEGRRELFDLPGMPMPGGEAPAPVRFLPEYDNLLLSHSNRTRIIADEYRPMVYLPGLRVRSTILLDGFVAGAWKVERKKKSATLTIEPFVSLLPQHRTALLDEAEQLVRFVEPDAATYEIAFAK